MKYDIREKDMSISLVAPYAGAWIEIRICPRKAFRERSLPMRERGLKSYNAIFSPSLTQSLPMRERGLKYFKRDRCSQPAPVAPYAGAWIEISILRLRESNAALSLPMRERGLK